MSPGDYGAVLLLGFLGGAHCAGMCAPFALAVSVGTPGRAAHFFARHLAYQLGKGAAYVLLGVLLHLATGWIDVATPVGRAQDWLAWLAGGAMILVGLGYTLAWGGASASRWLAAGGLAGRACGALRVLWHAPTLWRATLIGWLNGFLPCGLSFSALLFLVSRDSLEGLVAGAFLFSLATLPALALVGWLGGRISHLARGRWLRAAGLALALFGLLTVFRGEDAVHHFFHSGPGHTH